MLSKHEHEVMAAVYEAAKGGSCLISPSELLNMLPKKSKWTENRLYKTLTSLELDDFFDLTDSDRKGERILCINLRTKGLAYKRSEQQAKRGLYFRIGLSVALAVLSFIIGRILYVIFT